MCKFIYEFQNQIILIYEISKKIIIFTKFEIMADLAGLLMSIYDQNCKILKRIHKLENHVYKTTKFAYHDVNTQVELKKVDIKDNNSRPTKTKQPTQSYRTTQPKLNDIVYKKDVN